MIYAHTDGDGTVYVAVFYGICSPQFLASQILFAAAMGPLLEEKIEQQSVGMPIEQDVRGLPRPIRLRLQTFDRPGNTITRVFITFYPDLQASAMTKLRHWVPSKSRFVCCMFHSLSIVPR